MYLFLFVIIHIAVGCALIYTYGKLPKMLSTFAVVFLAISFLYWGAVLIHFIN
ncbi:hypothetical protein KIS4809_0580 [Bacillus sp. ZZV12-4809]|nr:hypothetical protein KIS4809_0580 [Bacillus sp. ZZV12-4809]